MPEFWETAFTEKQLMWGEGPALAAVQAAESFSRRGAKHVLIPGLGYGRNAKPFLERGMAVTGIEISATAIELAKSRLGLDLPIHHGSVTDMPFDQRLYDGVFCHGLIHLLDERGRAKLIEDCFRQLAPGGALIFTAITTAAPMYGQGAKLGNDWFERLPGLPMFFYGEAAVRREFGPFGLVGFSPLDEPSHGGALPFFSVVCAKP